MEHLRQLASQIRRDDMLGLSAELAYRFFLTIFPFFLFLTSLGHLVAAGLGLPNPATHFAALLSQIMPPEAAGVFEPELEYVFSTSRPGVLSLGLASALWLATGSTSALMKGLNRAYAVEETRPVLRRYLLALGLTVLAGSAIGLSFVLLVGGRWFGNQLAAAWGFQETFAQTVELLYWPIVGALLSGAVAVLYRLAPNCALRWRAALPGAVLFTVSWMVATGLFAWWAEQLGTYRLTYGTLAGVVALLLWFYLTALCLLLGAEVNAQLDQARPQRPDQAPLAPLADWAASARTAAARRVG